MMKRVLFLIMACLAVVTPSFSQVLLEENFDAAATAGVLTDLIDNNTGQPLATPAGVQVIVPDGWSITTEVAPGETRALNADWPYPAWTACFFDGEWSNTSDDRAMDAGLLDGILAVDSRRCTNFYFKTWAVTPTVNTTAASVVIEFNQHYRHYVGQLGSLEVSWDGKKTWTKLFQYDNTYVTHKQNFIAKEKIGLKVPAGASSVTLRFFLGGDSSQTGYLASDCYWAIDNLKISGSTAALPGTPTLTAAPSIANGLGDIQLTGSTYTGSAAHTSSEWQAATDKDFASIIFLSESATNLTSVKIPTGRVKMDTPIFVRVRYIDANGFASDFSNVVQTSITAPSGLIQIEKEDFESTPEYEIPTGWTDFNFSADIGPDFTTWMVITEETFIAMNKPNRINRPVYEGKSCYITSDTWDPIQDDHLLSKRYNLTGVKNVWLTFWSNYMQNQDNIGVLEYSVDGGNLDADRNVKGTWLPLWYSMQSPDDMTYNADGTVDAATTLRDANLADGTNKPYNYWVFARPFSDLGPYFVYGRDDDDCDGKQYLKFPMPAAANQADVVIRWVNMGTNSWFWGIDNVTIWGDKGTDVSDWSLF